MSFADVFERYGYDPDDPVRELDIPARLLEDLAGVENDEEDGEAA